MTERDPLFSDRRSVRPRPPVAPGTSPFQIKGAGFLGHMAWVDESYPGGRAAFLAALSPDMRAYFESVFLAMSWYDLVALASAGAVCADVMGMPFRDFIAMRARHQANHDVTGMYKMLLRLANPRMIAPRIPKMMSNYLDFGEVRVRSEQQDGMIVEVLGVPVMLADWLVGCYQGFLEVLVRESGGRDAKLVSKINAQGSRQGFPMGTLEVTVSWG